MLVGREPALWLSLVSAIIAVLVGFGLPISAGQVGLLNALTAALVGMLIRQNVSPVLPPV